MRALFGGCLTASTAHFRPAARLLPCAALTMAVSVQAWAQPQTDGPPPPTAVVKKDEAPTPPRPLDGVPWRMLGLSVAAASAVTIPAALLVAPLGAVCWPVAVVTALPVSGLAAGLLWVVADAVADWRVAVLPVGSAIVAGVAAGVVASAGFSGCGTGLCLSSIPFLGNDTASAVSLLAAAALVYGVGALALASWWVAAGVMGTLMAVWSGRPWASNEKHEALQTVDLLEVPAVPGPRIHARRRQRNTPTQTRPRHRTRPRSRVAPPSSPPQEPAPAQAAEPDAAADPPY